MSTTSFNFNKKYWFYYGLIYIIPFFSIAQNQDKDSIIITNEMKDFILNIGTRKQVKKLIRKTLRTEKDTSKSLALVKLFLERGIKERNDTILYFSQSQKGFIAYKRSNHINAVKSIRKALKSAKNLKDTTKIINSNILLGSSYYLLGIYDEAVTYYLAAKKFSEFTKDYGLQSVSSTNIANNKLKLSLTEDALKGYNKALDILKNSVSEEFIAYKSTKLSALLGKGKCLAELGRLDEAMVTLNKLVKEAEKENIEVYKGYAYINIGEVFFQRNEFYKALGYLNQAKEVLANNSGAISVNIYIANYYIAKCYVENGALDKGLEILDINFFEIGNATNIDKIEEMYELAIHITKIKKDQTKQIYYYDKLQQIIKLKLEKKLTAKDLLYEEDIKDFEKRNEALKKAKNESIINEKITLFVAVVFIIVLLLVFLNYRKKAKNNEQRFLAIIKELEKNKTEKRKKVVTKYEIKDEKAEKILEQLQTLETTLFYLSKECNLYATAKLLETNTTYLSKALNKRGKQTFNQYLNELRVNYALLKLKEDPIFRSYTIRAVASEIGYKSHTTFIKVFKEKTGVTPSYYIKKLG
ncbi:response regulator transcription factor [Tenacibaculum agarivorans]|uniref:response regulator transcription factor n=1 Tax=Tenacibaculum agarivorans TaxID=1908389 RepID=UPI00094BC604|nr:response regulator transcription factor [Tenacibaculum agarivorans]